MRKKIISPNTESIPSNVDFLDLEQLAQVEISSECQEYPIEAALLDGKDSGWQAYSPGEQSIRLVFDKPQDIKYVLIVIDEYQQARTQEFTLLVLKDKEEIFRKILRQEYHFSPPITTRQTENYTVDLKQIKALELKIIPDLSGGVAYAKLKKMRLG